jgi:hypothetical protein
MPEMTEKSITRRTFLGASAAGFMILEPEAAGTAPWRAHGRLRPSANGHFLTHADGTPFFWLGSTAWTLHQNISKEDALMYLDDARSRRFNVIQLFSANSWALTEGKTYYGAEPYLGGDATKLNPPYWDHLAWVIDEAARRNLYVLLVYGAPGRKDSRLPFANSPAEAHAYGLAVGRHLGPRPNLIWSNGFDVAPDDAGKVSAMGMEGWHAMARGVIDGLAKTGKTDPRDVLMTYHPCGPRVSSEWFHTAPWLSFHGAQVGLTGMKKEETILWHMIGQTWDKEPPKPVVNLEPWYEDGGFGEKPIGVWETRLQAYQSLFAGACGYTYGHQAICGFRSRRSTDRWKQALEAQGRNQMQWVRKLFESFPVLQRVANLPWILDSDDHDQFSFELKRRISMTGSRNGRYAFVYTPQGKRFTLDMSCFAGGSVAARWFDPRTGNETQIGEFKATGERQFTPPDTPAEGNDWVLVLSK